jgi:hypothetical protein
LNSDVDATSTGSIQEQAGMIEKQSYVSFPSRSALYAFDLAAL